MFDAIAAGTVTVNGATAYGVSDSFTVTVIDFDFSRKTGDVNGDGEVNVIDLVRAKKHVAGAIALTDLSFSAADFDKNGIVNAADLLVLRKKLLSIHFE